MRTRHQNQSAGVLERFFELRARRSSVGAELRGAAATFLTSAYILVANPAILAAAGVPVESAVACTATAAMFLSAVFKRLDRHVGDESVPDAVRDRVGERQRGERDEGGDRRLLALLAAAFAAYFIWGTA